MACYNIMLGSYHTCDLRLFTATVFASDFASKNYSIAVSVHKLRVSNVLIRKTLYTDEITRQNETEVPTNVSGCDVC